MSKVFIEEASLTAIGDAIRAKAGSTELLSVPTGMVDAITNLSAGGGGEEVIPSEIISPLDYWNYKGHNDWVINLKKPMKFMQQSTTPISNFFQNSADTVDASHLTFVTGGLGTYAFNGCEALQFLPKIYFATEVSNVNCGNMFHGCNNLQSIPEDFFMMRNSDGEIMNGYFPKSLGGNSINNMFYHCYSLRKHPEIYALFEANNGSYTSVFQNCYALDEIRNVPVPSSDSYSSTSNKFSNTFARCSRAKSITFRTQENGSSYLAKWSNQTIDLSNFVGYTLFDANITNYNSGLTTATQVTDAASYAALKDNEDWWTMDVNFSRYNHDSAVETINSLPDTLTVGGSGNTIKFTGASGASTDGGAINTLTEEEIAVATAKGWTVSLV